MLGCSSLCDLPEGTRRQTPARLGVGDRALRGDVEELLRFHLVDATRPRGVLGGGSVRPGELP